jgi:CheY-like chemotaxis protein
MIAQIIVADDDEDLAALLEEYLAGRGHRVLTVHDGFALTQKAAEHRPHLIITDIQMPGAYGSSVYQVLQQDSHTRDIPILFISAHSLEQLAGLIPDDPKTRFLQKPVAFSALERCVAELLPLGGYVP